MLSENVSTGVISNRPIGRTSDGLPEGLSGKSAADQASCMVSFMLQIDSEETASHRCDLGFEVPAGGLYCGPVENAST